MKEQQAACAILLLIILGLGFGTNQAFQGAVTAEVAVREAEEKALAAQDTSNRETLGLRNLKTSTQALRDFRTAWQPYLEEVSRPQRTEQMVIDSIKEKDVFALSQRFELLKQKGDPLIQQKLRAHLTIEDEYSKTLNWMASIEQKLPASRVESCRIVRGETGDDLRLELVLDIPVTTNS